MPGLGVDLRIVSEDESLCKPGEMGEIRVKSPTLFSGYFDATLNEGAFDESGYLHTGDLGYLDEDGYLIISGRIKDVILRKGETLDAKEIEDVLAAYSAIAEAAVVGLPDDERGELVCAVLVMRESADNARGAAGISDITEHLERSGLMKQKFPERFEFVDALPRNPTGKVLKQELRRRLAGSPAGSAQPGVPTAAARS
jgi:acyl-CoA synthetase (AMP-forming)/AMP-acid ligase II